MALSTFVKEFFGTIKGVANAAGVDVFVAAETDGSLKNVLYGKDSSGNQDPLRTNANQQLQVEVVNAPPIQVDPVVLTASNVAVFNPGTDSAEIYDVRFLIANTGSAPCTVGVGIDLGGGTTIDRAFFDGYVIPPEETTGWRYLGRIAGDDDIVAVNATAATVTATIFFEIDQLV